MLIKGRNFGDKDLENWADTSATLAFKLGDFRTTDHDTIPYYKLRENFDYISWTDTEIKIILPSHAIRQDSTIIEDYPDQYPGTGTFKVITADGKEAVSPGKILIEYVLRNTHYTLGDNAVKFFMPIPKQNCINGYKFQVSSSIAADARAIACIKKAMKDWSDALNIELYLETDSMGNPVVNHNSNPWAADGIHTISYTCTDALGNPNSLMATYIHNQRWCTNTVPTMSYMRDFDIGINNRSNTNDWHKDTNTTASSSKYCFYTAILHELGHVLTLKHSANTGDLMNTMLSHGEKNTLNSGTPYALAGGLHAVRLSEDTTINWQLGDCVNDNLEVLNSIGEHCLEMPLNVRCLHIPLFGIRIEWDSMPNATSYIFEYSTDSDFSFTIGREMLPQGIFATTLADLLPGETYFFRVKARNLDRDSQYDICNCTIDNFSEVLFVKKGGSGSQDGSNWANAMGELAIALHAACSDPTIQQIWVAQGTYYPMYAADESSVNSYDQAFVLVNNVKIYGGFAGYEQTLNQRDWKNNPTILSGNIGNSNSDLDNVSHVVISAGDIGDACLDGFTITNGYAMRWNMLNVNGYDVYAYNGGGIYIVSSHPQLTNLVITGNQAINYGGGIYIDQDSYPYITHLTISENEAHDGAGMFNDNYSAPNMENIIIKSNIATNRGGGVMNFSSSPTFINALIVENEANQGGGVYNFEYSSPVFINVTISQNTSESSGDAMQNDEESYPEFYNSIVYGNEVTHWCSEDYTSNNSLIQVASDGGGDAAAEEDPLFVDMNNGNYRLKANSPCIDMGDDAYVPSDIFYDIEGNLRFNNTVDMGAYEHGSMSTNQILYVDQMNEVRIVSGEFEETGLSWKNAFVNLSDALALAATNSNVTQIWVAQGTYYPLYIADVSNTDPRTKAFVLPNNVQIYGGFSSFSTAASIEQRSPLTNLTILSGDIGIQGDNVDNVYHVVIAAGDLGTACLDGFVIEVGNATMNNSIMLNNESVNNNSGAGLYIVNSSPTLTNLFIEENEAINYGGGIYIENSSLVLTNVEIQNNYASIGGGICVMNSSFNLHNTLIVNNYASLFGGGIYSGNNSIGTLVNITTADNYATNRGSVLYNSNSILNVFNSIIWGMDIINTNGGQCQYEYCAVEGMFPAGNNLDERNAPAYVFNSDYMLNNNDYRQSWIDAGDNQYVGTLDDLNGNSRIVGDIVDLGAYEFQRSNRKSFAMYNDTNKIERLLENLKLSIYPNPTSIGQQTKLFLGENNFYYENPVNVKLYSLDGKLLHYKQYSNGNTTLDLPQLSVGVYLIKAQTQEGKIYNAKLVITR